MLFTLVLVSLTNSKIPEEYKGIANRAIQNSKIKTPRELRQDSMLPGEYDGPFYHYKLLKAFSNSHSKDIKGYAIDQNCIAIVKRKNFSIKNDFVFVDEINQKIYHMTDVIASENNVFIYKLIETSIFHVLTNFHLNSSTKTQSDVDISIGDDINNPSFKINFQWDENRDRPKLDNLEETGQVKAGYGSKFEVNINTNFAFNNIRDVKLSAEITLDAVIGAEVLLEDDSKFEIDPINLFSISKSIPPLGKEFPLMGLKIKIGVFFNFKADLTEMSLNIPIGFDYFKGYRMVASRYFEITPKAQLSSDWKIELAKLPEGDTLADVIKSIDSAYFIGTLAIEPSFSFKIDIGDNKFEVKVGILVPMNYQFDVELAECQVPFLKGSLEIPIAAFIELPELKILGYTIYEKKRIEGVFYTVSYDPFCLGRVPSEKLQESLPDDEKESSSTTAKLNADFSSIKSSFTFKVNFLGTNKMAYLTLTFPDEFIGHYSYWMMGNTGLEFIYDTDRKSFSESNFYFKIPSQKVTFPIRRKTTENNEVFEVKGFFFKIIGLDDIPVLKPKSKLEIEVDPNYLTVYLAPVYNGAMYDTKVPQVDNQGQLVEDFSQAAYEIDKGSTYCLVVFKPKGYPKNYKLRIYQTSTVVKENEPYNTVDIGFIKELTDIGSVSFTVFSENADKMACTGFSSELTAEKDFLEDNTKKVALFKFIIPKGSISSNSFEVTFLPLCSSGSYCHINFDANSGENFYLLSYPNTDGISITGSGFLTEIIKAKGGENLRYFKTYNDAINIQIIEKVPSSFSLKLDDAKSSSKALAESGRKRICVYGDDENIYPFSRKIFLENMKTILVDDFGLNVPTDDYSKIATDADGCIEFESSYLPGDEEFSFKENYIDFFDHQSPSSSKKKGLSTGAIVGIVIGCLAAVAIIVVVVVVLKKKKNSVGNSESQ